MQNDIIIKLTILSVLNSESRYFTLSEIARICGVSKNTIRSYIVSLNYILPSLWTIDMKTSVGYILSKPAHQSFYYGWSNIWTESLFFDIITYLLVNNHATVSMIAEKFFISTRKVQSFLKSLTHILAVNDLQLIRKPYIQIVGPETAIRIFYYWRYMLMNRGEMPNDKMQSTIPNLAELVAKTSSTSLRKFPIIWRLTMLIAIALIRNEHGHLIVRKFPEFQPNGSVATSESYQLLKQFIQKNYHTRLSIDDIDYIYLVATRFNDDEFDDDFLLYVEVPAIQKIIDDFQNQLPDNIMSTPVLRAETKAFLMLFLREWIFYHYFAPYLITNPSMQATHESATTSTYYTVIKHAFNYMKQENKLDIFSDVHLNMLVHQLESLILAHIHPVKITLLLSTNSLFASYVTQLLKQRYGWSITICTQTNLSALTYDNTDLIISDVSFVQNNKNIPIITIDRPMTTRDWQLIDEQIYQQKND